MKRSSKVAQRVAGTERPEPGVVDYTVIIRQYGRKEPDGLPIWDASVPYTADHAVDYLALMRAAEEEQKKER